MRRFPSLPLAIAVPLALAAAPAWSAEKMPQLDFANPLTLSNVYWGALIFFIFFVLVRNFGLPQVTRVLETREVRIRTDLEAAHAAKAEADGAVRELTETTAKARADAQAAINAAVEEARAAAAQKNAALAAKLDQQIADAEQRIAAARRTAMGALRQVADETASAILARLVGYGTDRSTIDLAVGAHLSSRGLS
jgi:F-type H+-transporting ATPase subunit b